MRHWPFYVRVRVISIATCSASSADRPEAEPVFAAAAVHLDGVDPREFVAKANQETLFSNHSGQILCCTQALASWALVRSALPAHVVIAGYSVGELAAWGCAGIFEPIGPSR